MKFIKKSMLFPNTPDTLIPAVFHTLEIEDFEKNHELRNVEIKCFFSSDLNSNNIMVKDSIFYSYLF